MAPYSGEHDKRQYLRIATDTVVKVSRLEYPTTSMPTETANTKDMSEKGICFTAPTLYQQGTLMNLKIELRGWQQYLHNVASIVDVALLTKPLTAIAEVRWSKKLPGGRKYEIGVCFKDIYEDDYQAFMKYLEQLITRNKQ